MSNPSCLTLKLSNMTVPIVLFGAPGSGKSLTARALSSLTRMPYQDTDLIIEKRAGKSISQIFVEDGEEVFRAIEQEVVLELLTHNDVVIAVGGGSVVIPAVNQAIRDSSAIRIYLEVSLNVVAPRVGFNKDRPLLALNPRASWNALMEKRRPIYESLAQFTFSTDSMSPSEVADSIARALDLPRFEEGNHTKDGKK